MVILAHMCSIPYYVRCCSPSAHILFNCSFYFNMTLYLISLERACLAGVKFKRRVLKGMHLSRHEKAREQMERFRKIDT